MLSDNDIAPQAFELTLEVLQTKGLTRSDYMYTEVENTLYDAKQNDQHIKAVGWPDNTYCFFSSSEPLTLEEIFPAQLQAAYRNSLEGQRFYSLG